MIQTKKKKQSMHQNQKASYLLLLLCSFGGMLDFYDFIIYGLVAPSLSKNFFPQTNDINSIFEVLTLFAIGYIARPIGGVFFGHIGDLLGRKKAFLLTIFMMSTATFSIGLIPTFDMIGNLSIVLLIIFRFLQGFSIGGEIPGAITYVSETMESSRGWANGIMFFFTVNGITLGIILHCFFSSFIGAQYFEEFGWRILFWIAGLFGIISFCLRKKMIQSPLFSALGMHASFPLAYVFKRNKKFVLLGLIFVGLGAVLITEFFLFIPVYLKLVVHKTFHHLLQMTAVMCFISSLFMLLFGYLSDYLNRLLLMIACTIAALILSVPIFYWWDNGNTWSPLLLGAMAYGSIWGVIPTLLSDLFETEVRYSGIGFCYNVSFALFGGLGPMISLYLIHWTHQPEAPAYYIMAITLFVLLVSISIFCAPRSKPYMNSIKNNLCQM